MPPTIPGLDEYCYRGRHSEPVRMHLQEFAENSADMQAPRPASRTRTLPLTLARVPQHFDPLHGRMYIPFTDITLPGIMVDHNAEWVQDEKEPHVTYFLNHARRGPPAT